MKAQMFWNLGGNRQYWICCTNRIEAPMRIPENWWYCFYCDKMVPPSEQRNGAHNEAKGGCGHPMHSMKKQD